MPLGTSHHNPPPTLPFVGRQDELTMVDELLTEPQPLDAYRVVSFHGIGGQGKTSLLDQIVECFDRAEHRDQPFARLDFGQPTHRDPANALLAIRNQVIQRGLRTNAFDVAYSRYFSITRPGRDIRVDHPELFRFGSDSLLAELVDISGSVFLEAPGGKFLYSVLSKFSDPVVSWYKKRGSTILKDLDTKGSRDLLESLPMYLGADLCAWSQEYPRHRPVVLCDTYEGLWQSRKVGVSGSGDSQPSSWLRRLVEESPGSIFIIAGRSEVRWDRVDADWEPFLIKHSLETLAEDDQLQLMDSVGIKETSIRARFLETARGHPLSLRAQFNIYSKIALTDRAPVPEDFPSTQKAILDRMLEHMDAPLRAIVRTLAVPNVIYRQLWGHMSQNGFPMFDMHAPEEVFAEVAFITGPDGRIRMHDRVREHILEELETRDAEFLKRVRLALFDFFDAASSADSERRKELGFDGEDLTLDEQDGRLMEAEEHLLGCEPERYIEWCIKRFSAEVASCGSRERKRMLGQARHQLGSVATGIAPAAVALARLEIEGNPFSADARALLKESMDLLDDDNSDETLEHLAEACSHLLNVDAEFPLGRLHQLIGPGDEEHIDRLILDLRFANLEGDSEAQDRLLRNHLSDLAGRCPWSFLVAIAALDNENYLVQFSDFWEEHTSCNMSRHIHLAQVIDALLILGRPNFALKASLRSLDCKDLENLTKHALELPKDPISNCVLIGIVEALVECSELPLARRLIESRLSADAWGKIGNALESIKPGDFILNQWIVESGKFVPTIGATLILDRLLYIDAATSHNPVRPELSANAKLNYERIIEQNGVPASQIEWPPARSIVNTSRTFNVRFRRSPTNLNLIVDDNGESYLFTDHPLFCWRENDSIFSFGPDSKHWFFLDDATGWGSMGVPVPDRFCCHLGQRFKLLHVLVDDAAGESTPILGIYRHSYFGELDEIDIPVDDGDKTQKS